MQYLRHLAILALSLAVLGTTAPAVAQIGNPKCVDKLNNFAGKVSDTQAKKIRGCIKTEGKGKLSGTVEACVAGDAKQKLQKSQSKVSGLFANLCLGQANTDLVTTAAAINAAHAEAPADLIHDIFGADLDSGVLQQSKPANQCQDRLAQRSGQMFTAWVKRLRACVKAEMKGGAATAAEVVSGCLNAAPVRGAGSALYDPKDKIGKSAGKLATDVAKACTNAAVDLDVVAPASCLGGGIQGDFAACVQDLVECRACEAVAAATGLDIDCDTVDNDVIGTCPPQPLDPQCEILNGVECLLPWPSSRFQTSDPSTATGLRTNLPNAAMPTVIGAPWSPAPINQLDGFSPMTQILMHFPQGVDLAQTDAARLLAPGCCGQPAGPPWIDTRTYDSRSLDSDSPSVLLHADTGTRVMHWLERDGRATGPNVPGRQALFLRPAESLIPGERYIVAMRNLRTPGGDDVLAEGAFAALRDGIITGVPAVEARRAQMESDIFTPLVTYGVAREDLVLAFDFTVRSDHQLTHQMLSMRDQAFAWLDTVESDPLEVPFTVTGETIISACSSSSDIEWKRVHGTFDSPLFLTGQPVQTGPQFLNVDVDDEPVQNGFMQAPFDISIPCSVFDPGIVSRPIVLGHGIFGTGLSMVNSMPTQKGRFADWTYLAGGTDWIGLSSRRDDPTSDLLWIGLHVIGIGSSQFNNFPAFPARLRQGMLNQLVLGSMMKRGLFNRHAAFESSPGDGVFPGASEDMFYYGISLGGVHGTMFAALTPDVERLALDVPAINFSCLLQRSTQFSTFDIAIQTVGVTDPMQFAMLINLVHELWVGAEPAGFARHITSDPLPGSGSAKRILYTPAWLDKQVSNQCTEAAVRTLQLPNLEGSLVAGLQDIADVTGPVDSAHVMYSNGSFDLFNPLHQPLIPPLANIIPSNVCDPHSGPPSTPAAIRQVVNFLQPGGQVENFCNGPCDAAEALETPGGGTCDLSSPPLLQGAFCALDAECGGGTCVAVPICNPAP